MTDLADIEESYYSDSDLGDTLYKAETCLHQAQESMEALTRLMDNYTVLSVEMTRCDETSFESVMKPMLQLAVAGTDLEIVEVSTESAVEVIKSMGKAIIDLIRRIFDYVMDALTNFDLVATWMLRNIKLLERKRITSRGKVPKEAHVSLGSQHRFLRVGRIFADEPVRLTAELKHLLTVLQVLSNEFAQGLQRGASAVVSRGGSKTGSELDKALVDAIEDIGFSRIGNHLKMSSEGKDRWGREGVKASPPLLGGKSIFLFDGQLSSKGVKGLRFHGLAFGDTYRTPFPVAESREFVTLTTSSLAGIPDLLTDIVGIISNAGSKRVKNNMKEIQRNLEQYANTRMGQSTVEEADMRAIRSVVNAFTNWSKNVIGPTYGSSLQVCRAVLAYAQASTKTYH